MSHGSETHPTRAQLQAFDAGTLSSGERESVERHVASCAACSGVLDELPEGPLVALLRALGTGGKEAHESDVTDLPAALAGHPHYRVLEKLGAGGMGVVYKAVHRLKYRVVALKVLDQRLTGRPTFVERFRREARAASRLSHLNVVTTYDAEQVGDTHFLVMEFVSGTSLDRVVERRGPLPADEACDLVRQAALGLQHAHERGVIHRDVKPANVLVTPAGRVKVLDFGLARVEDVEPGSAPSLPSATVVGTPDYIAPEQARDPTGADSRADIYSLGCTLYHLLAGRPPFPGGTVLQKLLAQQDCAPEALTTIRHDVPPALTAVMERMLAKDPARRYPTMAAVADALTLGNGSPVREVPSSSHPSRRTLIAGGVLLAAAAGAFAVFRPRPKDQPPAVPPDDQPPDIPPAKVGESASQPRLATAEELARQRTEMRDRAVEWIRTHNRWAPDHSVVSKTAKTLAPPQKVVDAFEVTFGDGTVKSGRRTILLGHGGTLHVFELTPEQARGLPTNDHGSLFSPYFHCGDSRRAVARVELTDLRIDNADRLPIGRPVTGTVAYAVHADRPDECTLRLSCYSDRRRHMVLKGHFRLPEPDRGTFTFSLTAPVGSANVPAGPVVLFIELATPDGDDRIIESTAAAAVVRFVPGEAGKP